MKTVMLVDDNIINNILRKKLISIVDKQLDVQELLRSKGYQVIVIDNLEDFKSAITAYLNS